MQAHALLKRHKVEVARPTALSTLERMCTTRNTSSPRSGVSDPLFLHEELQKLMAVANIVLALRGLHYTAGIIGWVGLGWDKLGWT